MMKIHKEFTKSIQEFPSLKDDYLGQSDDETDIVFEEIEYDDQLEEEIEMEIEMEKVVQFEKEIKIKVVIVDQLPKNIRNQPIVKFLTPIVSDIGLTTVGIFHTALIIGPWYIEWTNNSLCIPRKCLSKSALLTIDVGVIGTAENLDTVRDKIAKVIIDWNLNFHYSTLVNGKNQGNCQHFVDCILESLEIDSTFPGALGEFMEDLKKNGTSNLKFKMNQNFQTTFNIEEEYIIFESHRQLDLFLLSLLKIDPAFQINFPDEFMLLKSFDRAFWLKNNKYEAILIHNRKKIEDLRMNSLKFQNQKKMKELGIEELYHIKLKMKERYLKNIEEAKKHLEMNSPLTTEVENKDHCEDCPMGNPSRTKSFWN